MPPMRNVARHFAQGCASRPDRLNLDRVPPCHPSSTGRCPQSNNNQRLRNRRLATALQAFVTRSAHSAAPLERQPCTFNFQSQHCRAYNSRLPAHRRTSVRNSRIHSHNCREHLTATSAHAGQALRHRARPTGLRLRAIARNLSQRLRRFADKTVGRVG